MMMMMMVTIIAAAAVLVVAKVQRLELRQLTLFLLMVMVPRWGLGTKMRLQQDADGELHGVKQDDKKGLPFGIFILNNQLNNMKNRTIFENRPTSRMIRRSSSTMVNSSLT
ncbi:unnamed protein product [Amoebophrya sp. A25]|nr:unnamed protein product [Amoebophrya sp. A25]|eukprot:GSA25T00023764001.1